MDIHESRHGGYIISTDRGRFDVDVFHRFLSETSYWAQGRLRSTTEAAVDGSVIFGAYTEQGEMVGGARVVTDGVTLGWLSDVFVVDAHRGNGLGKALVDAVMAYPGFAELRRFGLTTADAHDLYTRHGFTPLGAPETWMERRGSTI